MDDSETVLKALDRMAMTATAASKASYSLDDKLRFIKLGRIYDDARRSIRLMHFEYQDAVELGDIDNG